jgi:cytoskeletal protein CcmA (bactofilin family)
MTTIGPSLIITGKITSNEDVTVQGRVNGTIAMEKGALLIAETATVEADTQGSRLTIHGTFSGDISASERVELSATARVNATLIAPALVIHEGAVFNGTIEVTGKGKHAQAPAA